MTPEELSNCRRHLTCTKEKDNYALKLFNILAADEGSISEDELKEKLYTKEGVSTFSVLAFRLKNKILDSLIMDINLKKEVYDECTAVKYDVKKKNMQASVLHLRGNVKMAHELYDKIIEQCKEYEIYDDLLEILYIKQQVSGLTEGREVYDELGKDILHYEKCRKALYKAKDYFHTIVMNVVFKANHEKYFAALKEAIKELEEYYKTLRSSNIGYFLYLLKLEYHLEMKQYEEGEVYCKRLVNLVKKEKSVYMKRRLGTAIINLANTQLYLYSFTSAEKNAKDAAKNFLSPGLNYAASKDIEFYSQFYSGNLTKALDILDEILSPEYLSLSSFWYNKRMYLKAWALFLLGKYNMVFETLQGIEEIENDKEGWNIGLRFLDILTDIERGKLDQVNYKIESLRIHLHRTSKQSEIKERDKLIHKLLHQLQKNSYDFKLTAITQAELLQKLQYDKDHAWEVKLPEMLVFHEWFIAKAEDRPYNHKEAVMKQQQLGQTDNLLKTG